MVGVETWFRLYYVFIAVAYGMLSVLIYRQMTEAGDTAMARFQLNPEKAATDFRILVLGTAGQIVAYGTMTAYTITLSDQLQMLGLTLTTVFITIGTYVWYRWWRRFR